MINDEPMFKSVGQALSVSFSVVDTDPTVKSSTEAALKSMAEKRYGEAPVLQTERSINKDGLTPGEFRAQCKLIVEMVDTKLLRQERHVIFARFSKKPVKRAEAVRGLRDQFAALCSTHSPEALLALIWGIYVPGVIMMPGESPRDFNARRKKREKEWSVRSIEKEYGGSKSTLHRDQQVLREVCNDLELQAQAKIEGLLLAANLLAPET